MTQRNKLLEAFKAEARGGCLQQHRVALEIVLLLVDHPKRLIPPWFQDAAVALGMPRNFETGEMLSRWLQDDGWIQHTAHPWVGKGMSAVWAYEPTEKWRQLVARATEPPAGQRSLL